MELPIDVVEALAVDVAQDYFNDHQLCLRYDLTLPQLVAVKKQKAFLKEVDEVKRVLEDGGEQFILRARKLAIDALETLDTLRQDVDTPRTLKARVANDIIEVAGLKRKPSEEAPATKLIINTNLSLGGPEDRKGTYTVEARVIRPEAVEIVRDAPRALQRIQDDGSDLV